ncbi:hypothetical protein [Paenacidovorax monticola]|uniref:Spy/CpxP family protein refolding chaperone n=1 Tax=Paenacidovorax monticola TaxID=1926868 RepID=A0A7H0HCI0_9BURK|nr:hypothetical protein [Paenacidovorax monticola]MBO9679743.1 hypothetical protein [Acidovorax sp.]QNP58246.1 hypothetical protein H9L24_14385 [Paenacidovorax monticola]
MRFCSAVAAIAMACAVSPALAGPATEALSTCFADHTSGKDRKELAKWVFAAMASHPEIRELSQIPQAEREKIDRSVGATVTRLLTESCPQQTRQAIRSDGQSAFKASFGILGQLAMQELMSNPAVRASFGGIEHHVDQKKIDMLLSPAE